MRSPALLFAVLLALPAVGCAHRSTPVVAVPSTPPQVDDLGQFEVALNRYVLLPVDHPARATHRDALSTFLEAHLQEALDDDDASEAETTLRFAVSLYTAGELRSAPPRPSLARAAHALYRHTARRGDESPSMLALAVEQRFGDEATRTEALQQWESLERWLVDNGPFATEPLLAHEDLERSLEMVAAYFPSPFVVKRLSDLYVARYDAAVQAHQHGGGLGNTSLRRIEITGYLLMRLHLRADDPEAAVAALDRVAEGNPIDKLRSIVEDAFEARRSARSLLSLAEQFIPEEEADPTLPYVTQSWGIIDNLTRRALLKYPKDPYVHLMRATLFQQASLNGAALHHLRRSVELKDDVFETWQQLALLEHLELSQLARRDPQAAMEQLGAIEDLHRRAVKLWRDRPIHPSLPEAYYVVAEALYQAGDVDDAQTLLDKSLAIEARPQALDLLGTIALKRARLGPAAARFEELARLPYEDPDAKLRWEARARGQLGEIALRRGDEAASVGHFRVALRNINALIDSPAITVVDQADRYLDRGHLLFLMGEVELATDDFAYAADLAPDHVRAYSDPLLQLISYGHYQEAQRVFHRAMAQGEVADGLKLYFSLWLDDLGQRQGQPPDSEAQQFLRGYAETGADGGGSRWGRKLARHARGELSYDQLLEGASDDGERTEAFFYEGLRRWRDGDVAAGKKLLQQVVDSNLMGFFEYDMAQAYLAWDDLPSQARAPRASTPRSAQRTDPPR